MDLRQIAFIYLALMATINFDFTHAFRPIKRRSSISTYSHLTVLCNKLRCGAIEDIGVDDNKDTTTEGPNNDDTSLTTSSSQDTSRTMYKYPRTCA